MGLDVPLQLASYESGYGGHTDDGTALRHLGFHHVRDRCCQCQILLSETKTVALTLDNVERSVKIDSTRPLPCRMRHGQEFCEGTNARVADQDICDAIRQLGGPQSKLGMNKPIRWKAATPTSTICKQGVSSAVPVIY